MHSPAACQRTQVPSTTKAESHTAKTSVCKLPGMKDVKLISKHRRPEQDARRFCSRTGRWVADVCFRQTVLRGLCHQGTVRMPEKQKAFLAPDPPRDLQSPSPATLAKWLDEVLVEDRRSRLTRERARCPQSRSSLRPKSPAGLAQVVVRGRRLGRRSHVRHLHDGLLTGKKGPERSERDREAVFAPASMV